MLPHHPARLPIKRKPEEKRDEAVDVVIVLDIGKKHERRAMVVALPK